jgi:hypothetical protein
MTGRGAEQGGSTSILRLIILCDQKNDGNEFWIRQAAGNALPTTGNDTKGGNFYL